MKHENIKIVLDTSAVLAYVGESIDVGETIAEVATEGSQFGVSVLCLAEASRRVKQDDSSRVRLLALHPYCAVLPVLPDDWPLLAGWARALGRTDLAASFMEATECDAYLLTAEPDRYDDGSGDLPVIEVNGPRTE